MSRISDLLMSLLGKPWILSSSRPERSFLCDQTNSQKTIPEMWHHWHYISLPVLQFYEQSIVACIWSAIQWMHWTRPIPKLHKKKTWCSVRWCGQNLMFLLLITGLTTEGMQHSPTDMIETPLSKFLTNSIKLILLFVMSRMVCIAIPKSMANFIADFLV